MLNLSSTPRALILLVALHAVAAAAQRPIVALRVDATDIRRKLIHAELEIPVTPGNTTIVYPKWIPGSHSPSGPLNSIVWLKFSAAGRTLPWTRDPVDMFAFHLQIPDGVQKLDVALDAAFPARHGTSATPSLFLLAWNKVLLYPQGVAGDDIDFQAEIRLPPRWKYACALPGESIGNDTIKFPVAPLTTLVDSPLLAGEHFRTFSLDNGPIPVSMAAAADSEEALNLSPELHEKLRSVIRETDQLFGARHYRHYTFLLSLSDEVGEDGIEHHQSTDITLRERVFLDPAGQLASLYLIPHEYVHSWNGKYRRPAGLSTKNYQDPMIGDLLWVYEGLTRYLNWVLAARSGLFTPEAARDYVAVIAGVMEHRSGRQWRSLEDTARSVQLLYGSGEWESLRRSVDYYDESLLLWLEVDQIIRAKTAGQKSLDDFCRLFFGPPGGPPTVKPYNFEDLVQALNAVAPYPWADMLSHRINDVGKSPLKGLTASGWNLVYDDTPGPVLAARNQDHQTIEERFSIGLLLHSDGEIVDIVRDSPAWHAGLGPGMKIIGVNGRAWSPHVLHDAIAASRTAAAPTEVLVRSQTSTFPAAIPYHAGLRYPRLERNSYPDTLSDMIKPRAEVR